MPVLDTLSEQLRSPVETETADPTSLATDGLSKDSTQEDWQPAIDKCIAWGESPSIVDEDDLESPSEEAASRAVIILIRLRDNGDDHPTWVVPTGEGGIMLKLIRGNLSTAFEIESDGTIEFRVFEDSKLTLRAKILL